MSTIVRLNVRLTTVNRRAWIAVGFYSAGLVVAFLAQRTIYDSGDLFPGALIYALAGVLLLTAWVTSDGSFFVPVRGPAVEAAAPLAAHPVRKYFVLPSFLFALIAFFELTGNRFTLPGTAAWLTSLALFLFAFWEGSPRLIWDGFTARVQRLMRRDTGGRRARWLALALLGIIGVGIFFFFYHLNVIPAEMTSDHAEKILDTYDILHGKYSIFFERNTGREPLQFYFNALVVWLKLAPLDYLPLKIVGASAGVLTIPAVFLLAREMFDDQVGLIAAFLFSISIFPVAIARVGLRYPLNPLFVAWTLYFLLRALRRQSRNDYLIAGLMLGLGLNGYSPFRVVVVLVPVWMALWLIWDLNVPWRQIPRFVMNGVLLFGVGVLVFLPMIRYTTEHPENVLYRMATRLTSLEQPVVGDPVQIFIQNNINAAGMFNLRGDVVWVNAVPNVPVVDWVIGACFLIGVFYGIYRLVRYREYPFALLFVSLFILLLPSTLALAFPDENPSVVRAGGVTPIVMIIAALPLALWWRQFARLGSRTLGTMVVGVVLLVALWFNYNLYFFRYDDQYRRVAWNSTEIAATLGNFAQAHNDWDHIYVVSAPYWVDYRAVGIHLGNYDFHDHLVETEDEFRAQAQDPAAKMYALKNEDTSDLDLLETLYPSGTMRQVFSRTPGRDFIVFTAPAR